MSIQLPSQSKEIIFSTLILQASAGGLESHTYTHPTYFFLVLFKIIMEIWNLIYTFNFHQDSVLMEPSKNDTPSNGSVKLGIDVFIRHTHPKNGKPPLCCTTFWLLIWVFIKCINILTGLSYHGINILQELNNS